MKNKEYISINKIAELKGLNSNRSLRLAIQKGKYIARVVKVFGGKSYEILYSSLEPEIQEKLQDELIKEATQSNCTALVPINNIDNNINNKNFITESAKLTALARVDIVKALQNMRAKYKTKKEADSIFLDLYNSGMYLPKIYKFIGSISIGTLHRWIWAYEDSEDYRVLLPNYKYTKQGEYNTILTQEMKDIFIKFLLHPNKFSVTKAIKLTQHILEKKGIENIPHVITFRRYAEHYKKNNYSRWILFREGEKAYHDKVEAYIERDISKLEVGDVLIADGHTLNFQVINPFTGKPTRANILFSKTLKAYLITTEAKLSKQYLKFSPTLGIAYNGNYLILSSSEYLKTGKECTLLDVMEKNVPEKYFLSPETEAKILARSINIH